MDFAFSLTSSPNFTLFPSSIAPSSPPCLMTYLWPRKTHDLRWHWDGHQGDAGKNKGRENFSSVPPLENTQQGALEDLAVQCGISGLTSFLYFVSFPQPGVCSRHSASSHSFPCPPWRRPHSRSSEHNQWLKLSGMCQAVVWNRPCLPLWSRDVPGSPVWKRGPSFI